MTEYVCMDNCGCDSRSDYYDIMERKLLQMAFWAHKEVLFEKLKQKIEQAEGKKLDALADLLIETSKNQWETSKESGKKREEFKNRLKELH